jgi:hypothetical protein
VKKIVWGNFEGFTLNYEGNLVGGIWFGGFFEVCSGVHVDLLRRGDS